MNTEEKKFKATYSVEDDKLRLYPLEEFDNELWEKLKNAGFNWAGKQKLVYGFWSPEREDICIDLAGDIKGEETTLVERAVVKADRLDGYAEKKKAEANLYALAADRIANSLVSGQPVLLGHHSQKSQERKIKKIERAKLKEEKCVNSVNWLIKKAEGVEKHANMKSFSSVRENRIKRLLKDLRDNQRSINHGYLTYKLWDKISSVEDVEKRNKYASYYAGALIKSGKAAPDGLWQKLDKKEITIECAINEAIEWSFETANCKKTSRIINHLLNRLAYERSELGQVHKFEGELTGTILKEFARENGAHSPVVEKVGNKWILSSKVPLPLHLCNENSLALDAEEWRVMMRDSGYLVPEKKPAKPSLINIKAESICGIRFQNNENFKQIELTKSEYQKIHSDDKGTLRSSCNGFRFRICREPNSKEEYYNRDWVAVYLTDSKKHDCPESESINKNHKIEGVA